MHVFQYTVCGNDRDAIDAAVLVLRPIGPFLLLSCCLFDALKLLVFIFLTAHVQYEMVIPLFGKMLQTIGQLSDRDISQNHNCRGGIHPRCRSICPLES